MTPIARGSLVALAAALLFGVAMALFERGNLDVPVRRAKNHVGYDVHDDEIVVVSISRSRVLASNAGRSCRTLEPCLVRAGRP
jgi:hypothetical protein